MSSKKLSNIDISFRDKNGEIVKVSFVKKLGFGVHGFTLLFSDIDDNKYAIKFFYPYYDKENVEKNFSYEYAVLNELYKKINCVKNIICFKAVGKLRTTSAYYDAIYNLLQKKMQNIIREDILYIVTDYIDGYELFSMVSDENSSVPSIQGYNVIDLMKKFLSLLDFLHMNGIAHTDIKLENIIYSNDNYNLIDFGTSCIRGTKCVEITGTPGYVPYLLRRPNQTFEDFTFQDIYSTFVVFYLTLKFDYPFAYEDFNNLVYFEITKDEIINDYLQSDRDKKAIADYINQFFNDVSLCKTLSELRSLYPTYKAMNVFNFLNDYK